MKGLILASVALFSALTLSPEPTKLAFGNKRTLTVTRTITSKTGARLFVLELKKNTKLDIKVTDLVKNGIVTNWNISDPNGDTFGQKGYEPWDGKIKYTGKYTIEVGINNMASNGKEGRFKMVLKR